MAAKVEQTPMELAIAEAKAKAEVELATYVVDKVTREVRNEDPTTLSL